MRFVLCVLILLLPTSCNFVESEPISLKLGISEDGMPFMDWEGNLYRDVQINGRATFPTGSEINAKFGKNKNEDFVIISAIVKIKDDDQLSLEGEYRASRPFTLHMLGTKAGDGVELSFEKGSGSIDFKGILYAAYTK